MSSSSGSSRSGRPSSPRVAASSCCVRCGHSRNPVRSLALRTSCPSVRCMRAPRSCVELHLLRRHVRLPRRTCADQRCHLANAFAVGGAEEQLRHAGKPACVVWQMVAGEGTARAAALESEPAERCDRRLAQTARLRHPVAGADLAKDRRVMDNVLDVALGVARVLEDHVVVIAELDHQPAQLLLVYLQSRFSFHVDSVDGGRDSSLSRSAGHDQLLLRAGRTKRVGCAALWAGNARRCTTLPPATRAATSTCGATTVTCAPSPISGPMLVLPPAIERNQRRAAASSRSPARLTSPSRVTSASAW